MKGPRRDLRVLIYSHDSFGLGHLRRCRAIAHALVAAQSRPVRPDPVGLADHRQLRLPRPRRFRADPGRHQAAQRRIHARYRCTSTSSNTIAMRASIIQHTADIFDPDIFIVDKEPLGLRGEVRGHADHAEGARHAPGAGPARRDGRADAARPRMGAQERAAGAARPLRRDLGLRPAADLRPAGRHRAAALGAQQDGLHRLSAAQRARTPCSRRSPTRRSMRPICWSPPAAAATARSWSTGCCAPTSTTATLPLSRR